MRERQAQDGRQTTGNTWRTHRGSGGGTVRLLEQLDNWAHVVVAAFFILMAATVIIHMGFIFLRQLPLIIPPTPSEAQATVSATPSAVELPPKTHADTTEINKSEGKPSENAAAGTHLQPDHTVMAATKAITAETPKAEEGHAAVAASEPEDEFAKNSLKLLSNILFVVILLELLRTIITYLETHDIQAIMQEFLVVGIISSVRKILLVGAEASLKHGASHPNSFRKRAAWSWTSWAFCCSSWAW